MTKGKTMNDAMSLRYYELVAAAARDGEDPLGIGGDAGVNDRDHVAVIDAAIEGLDDERAKAVCRALRVRYADKMQIDGYDPDADDDTALRQASAIDRIASLVMAHMGIEPLMAAWLSEINRGDFVLHGDDRRIDVKVTIRGTSVSLGKDVQWRTGGSIEIPQLAGAPDTIMGVLEAGRFRDLVSHPVLDAIPLETRFILTGAEGEFIVHVGIHDETLCAITPGEMLALRAGRG